MPPLSRPATFVRHKVSALPEDMKAELCKRMMGSTSDTQLLAWLNDDPKNAAVLKVTFGDDWKISRGALRSFRRKGFREYVENHREQKHYHFPDLSKVCGSPSDHSARITRVAERINQALGSPPDA